MEGKTFCSRAAEKYATERSKARKVGGQMLLIAVWLILQVAIFVILAALLKLYTDLIKYIRRAHPNTWHELGQPKFEFGQPPKASLSMSDFALFSSKYRMLRDPQLTQLIQSFRMFFGCGIISIIVLFIIEIYGHPWSALHR